MSSTRRQQVKPDRSNHLHFFLSDGTFCAGSVSGERKYARGIVGPAHVIAVEIDRDAAEAEAELEAALKAALARA